MTSQTGKQTITIHISTDISRSKDNWTMKFAQVIEYNIRNIFLEKSCANVLEKLVLDLFLKNQNWAYLWINSLKFRSVCSLFLLYVQFEDYQNILKLRFWPLAFTSFKGFLENKKRFGTSLSVSFSLWFLKKFFFHVIFY